MPQAESLGPFEGLVAAAGSLVAACVALLTTWKGRARWEPSEEDIPRGPERVGGLAAAVLVGLLWWSTREGATDAMIPLVLGLLAVCVVCFLLYGFLIQTQTFVDENDGRRIIGGFALTKNAKAMIELRQLTVQRFFAGTAFDPDEVWTRSSRAVAKAAFVMCYLGLTVAGTLALASIAVLVDSG